MIKISKNSLVLGCALLVGLAVGLISIPTFANGLTNRSHDKAPEYSVNANGQTYGTVNEAISDETEPDLIAAIGIDGTKGYVLSKDLQAKMPKTPEEAVAQTKELKKTTLAKQSKGSDIIREIPLYDFDGKTVIGKFGIVGLVAP